MFAGQPLLLLTTTGARSGLPRTNPAVHLPGGEDRLAVFASNGGSNCASPCSRNASTTSWPSATSSSTGSPVSAGSPPRPVRPTGRAVRSGTTRSGTTGRSAPSASRPPARR
ncbi:nitroreductase/quinone reductase family protein [Streptomyces monomycini]|uniref:nitroreductase/quinone reductase family protein n=1 Tax=Streptomyces monomycini TaxID=371720 RepID=UPI003558BEE4